MSGVGSRKLSKKSVRDAADQGFRVFEELGNASGLAETPIDRARAILRAGHFENSVVLMQAHGLLLRRVGHIDSLDHCNCDVAAQYRLHRQQYEELRSS